MEGSTGAMAGAVVSEVGGLWERLAGLTDARSRRGTRYPLPLVVTLVVLAKLGGEDRLSGIADWITHRRAALQRALGLALPRTPQHNTYRRVLERAVGPAELDAVIGECFSTLPTVGASWSASTGRRCAARLMRQTRAGSTCWRRICRRKESC